MLAEAYNGPDPIKDLYKRLIVAGIVLLILIALTPFMGAIKRRIMSIKFLKNEDPAIPKGNDRAEAYKEQPK